MLALKSVCWKWLIYYHAKSWHSICKTDIYIHFKCFYDVAAAILTWVVADTIGLMSIFVCFMKYFANRQGWLQYLKCKVLNQDY